MARKQDTLPLSELTLDNVPELVTLREAAAATRLSVEVVRAAIRNGSLPAFMPGGPRNPKAPGRGMGYRIRKGDLQRWYFGEAVKAR